MLCLCRAGRGCCNTSWSFYYTVACRCVWRVGPFTFPVPHDDGLFMLHSIYHKENRTTSDVAGLHLCQSRVLNRRPPRCRRGRHRRARAREDVPSSRAALARVMPALFTASRPFWSPHNRPIVSTRTRAAVRAVERGEPRYRQTKTCSTAARPAGRAGGPNARERRAERMRRMQGARGRPRVTTPSTMA
jgi:hypothetical protein